MAGFMSQSPLDSKVTQQVKMAANVIDRFGFDALLPTYLLEFITFFVMPPPNVVWPQAYFFVLFVRASVRVCIPKHC